MKADLCKCLATITLAACFSLTLRAEVKLPHLISDGMVLQRDLPLKIWGWAGSDEKVIAQFKGQTLETTANKQGNWKLIFPASKAGGPFTMKINEHIIDNILIGDVWLCSGQSNMELPIYRVLDLYQDEISKVNNPDIRQFRIPMHYNFQESQIDCKGGLWVSATPEYIMDFSAVAYFFADDLYKKYHIPIGLINSAVGGSPAEAWLSEESLKKYPEHWQIAQVCSSQTYIDSVLNAESTLQKEWFSELNSKDPGISQWSKSNVNTSEWSVMSLPGYWTDKGLEQQNGSVWFHKEFKIPESLQGKEAILRLGCIIDSDSAFVNGTFVGTTSYRYPPRIYKIPEGLLKKGGNEIAIRVICQSGKGGFVEEKPYKIIIDDQTIDLTGDWGFHAGAVMPTLPQQTFFQYKPGGLYNGMINPLTNFGLKGVIWYQGESNTGRASEYRKLFPELIRNWRSKFNMPELPFVYVQLANFGKPSKQPFKSNWAELREAQRRTLELPFTGMAVTVDIGEWNDIHPLNKKEVGHRLFLQAGKIAYHDSVTVSSGPLYEKMEIEGNCIILTFSSVGSGLFANNVPEGFSIAGDNGSFVRANAVVLSKNKVRVWSDRIKLPVAVRYAWANNPNRANLKNKEGLPASPFTTNK